ncbi:DMT family transporter [Terrilactibacillus laevilacticus]|uniref:DMT family transporter n=1 Tax=Terrilactibacillus laevilacticus TaxID=1380157 RepID=UPI0011472838|nr:EamA family transporter [Terrilactibacillus laevilacticus]
MKHFKIYAMLLGFSIFTGATFNLAKYTLSSLSPSTAAAWRFGLAAVIMLIILATTQGIKLSILRENAVTFFILGIIGIFGFNALFFIGLEHTSPLNGALIMGTNPLLTTILARLILKDAITKRQIIGIVFALVGVLLVLTQGSLYIIKNVSFSVGDIAIMGGNLSWALYGILGRRFVKNSNPLATTTYTMVIGAIGLIIISFFTSTPVHLQNIPVGVWGAIIFMGFFTSVLGYLWWNKGMKEIGAGKTSLFFNVVPVVTMMISFFVGTAITIFQIVGTLLVIIGVLSASGLMRLPQKNTTKQSEII